MRKGQRLATVAITGWLAVLATLARAQQKPAEDESAALAKKLSNSTGSRKSARAS
jgi:hypothetical protein